MWDHPLLLGLRGVASAGQQPWAPHGEREGAGTRMEVMQAGAEGAAGAGAGVATAVAGQAVGLVAVVGE